MNNQTEGTQDFLKKIELSLPLDAEFVSTARLTVSSIASKMGFNIDDVEDITVALSEICNKLVSKGSTQEDSYKIIFGITPKGLTIMFDMTDESWGTIFETDDSDLGVEIIKALMDEAELSPKNGKLIITKFLKGEE